MSVARVTEITASSSKSFDGPLRQGLAGANKTLENVTEAWIKDQRLRNWIRGISRIVPVRLGFR